MKRILVSCLLVMILLAGLFTACAPAEEKPPPPPTPPGEQKPPPTPTAPPAEEKPELLVIAAESVGTAAQVIGTAIAHSLTLEMEIYWKLIPFEHDKARYTSVVNGESFMVIDSLMMAKPSMYNEVEYDSADWEPMMMRNVMHGGVTPVTIMVSGNSDIYTIPDLAGKRLAIVPGWPVSLPGTLACLAHGGLTENDVTLIEAAGYVKSIEMVGDGSVDGAFVSPISTAAIELDASPAGVRFIAMPFANEEGWKRFLAIAPLYPAGVWDYGILEGKPTELGLGVNFAAVMDYQPEELVYDVVKALFKTWPDWKDFKLPDTAFYSLENTLSFARFEGLRLPYHDGFVKYAKEIGRWTTEHEEFQEWAVAGETERMDAWKAKWGK